jgi:formate dehydrogenase major subunit
VGCEVSAVVEHNRIVKLYAKQEHEVSRGQLCIKGHSGWDFVHSPNRLPAVKIKKSFYDKNRELFGDLLDEYPSDDGWIYPPLEVGYDVAAKKLNETIQQYGNESFCSIGGARTSCESAYLFQKFTREAIGSPHVDTCARICHSPSLKGMRAVIGEGAATNPFSDIINAENLIIIGSNTTEAHPIVSYRVIEAVKQGTTLSVIDVRQTDIGKFATHALATPYESNLLVLNMLAYVILSEHLYDTAFITQRSRYFEEYKASILSDEYANPDLFQSMAGYEHLTEQIKAVARDYAAKKSMILWGLGISEHIDGSTAVMAICNLALLTGNIGGSGVGLMPLRGQNNVQGACDMGCLPYYLPDYQHPEIEGMMTPDMIDAMCEGKLKVLFNVGEDIAHVHPNQNKVHQALENLEMLIVNELFECEITRKADIVFGVKSAYEKRGVYVNAERRLHLSTPMVESELPDDWEVIAALANRVGADFGYQDSEAVWEEVRVRAPNRFSGASYQKLEANRLTGIQWPVREEGLAILHTESFRTEDGIGVFRYTKYRLRGHVEELLNNENDHGFYLTTGRRQ